jgi:CDP-diacylglycerol--glycerol-3-phosphate 3-phosphatidyltransferase
MPSIYQLKPAFQNLLRPISSKLVGSGVRPNHVTTAAIVLSSAAGGLILWFPAERWPLLLLPVTLLVRMALNAIDGMMAREHGLTSGLGAILNEVGDVVSDAALYLPLATVPGMEPMLVVPTVLLAVISEMTGLVGIQIGGSRRYDGPMGKSDRAFIFGLAGLLLGLGLPPGWWFDAGLTVVLVLLVVTVINRARNGLREISE